MTYLQQTGAWVATLCLVVAGTLAPVQTQAQSYDPTIANLQAQVVQLQQIVAQLQQQLATQQSGYYYTTTPTYYYPTTQSYGDINVDTLSVTDTDDDETTLNGEIDLNGASYAYVWFEYGQDDDYDDRTSKVRINGYGGIFSARLTNLDDDEQYVFRAVGEDQRGDRDYGKDKYFELDGYRSSSNNNDDEPDAFTDDADDVEDNEAELRGEVDMNDLNNGYVFFVYGEDEDEVEDVEDKDEYRDIDEDGDDLQKIAVDSDLDGSASYYRTVTGLDSNTDHYFRICVEYEDDDDDETLECGDVEDFETDSSGSNNDDEPEATTNSAQDIEDDEAELRGEVDMNDFNNGEVFFVYGEDEDQIDDVERDFDSYSDVDEDGDDLQKVRVDSDLDGNESYNRTVTGLDDNTDHYFRICVGYEDDDDDDVLECGSVRNFETD